MIRVANMRKSLLLGCQVTGLTLLLDMVCYRVGSMIFLSICMDSHLHIHGLMYMYFAPHL